MKPTERSSVIDARMTAWQNIVHARLATLNPTCLDPDSPVIADLERVAVALGMFEGRTDIPEKEVDSIIAEFEQTRAQWMLWQNVLNGLACVAHQKGGLAFRISEFGMEAVQQNPGRFGLSQSRR